MKILPAIRWKAWGLFIALSVSVAACTLPLQPASPEQGIKLTEQAQNIQMLTEQAADLAARQTAEAQAPPAKTIPTATLNVNPASPQTSAPPAASPGNQQPTVAPPISAAPTLQQAPTQQQPPPPTAQGPTSMTTSYVELYDWYSSNQGVDLDNSGGLDEMAFTSYKSSNPHPGNGIGQLGGRGTMWATWGSAPSYEDCRSINSWYPSIFIEKGEYLCYITDQSNYGYLRVDRLEQIGTGGSELQPWVLGFSFTTWLP